MNSVFEKIKEKLEELKDGSGFGGTLATMYGDKKIQEAISIVEEVEKEYREDTCEWEEKIVNKELVYKNCKFDIGEISPYTFSLCPYCGKKIKIKEVE